MKIRDTIGSVNELNSQFKRVNSDKIQNNIQGTKASIGDAVNVSPALREQVVDPVRAAKVEELKIAVRNDSYSPDLHDVAKSVIRDLF